MSDSARPWAFVPAALLGSMLLGLGTLTYIATDDPHFALEPNYYDKAVHWEQAQAQARRSQASGVAVELLRAPSLEQGQVTIELRVRDASGAPLGGANVALEAFPNAFANQVTRAGLSEIEPGVYRGALRGTALGLWELRCAVTRGELRFEQTLRADVVKGPSA
jgi:hypothetical protein